MRAAAAARAVWAQRDRLGLALRPNAFRSALVWLVKSRLGLAILLPAGLVALAAIAFFVILLGRWEQRREIARSMSRVLSACWDGQGDCSFSAWSYRMVIHGKPWGAPRVRFVDWINDEEGHCLDAYLWHEKHGLLDRDENE